MSNGRNPGGASREHRYRPLTRSDLPAMRSRWPIPRDDRRVLAAVSAVFPFRTNEYVLNELVDWDRVPDDPMYQMVFPQPGMLSDNELKFLLKAITEQDRVTARNVISAVRAQYNPHPGGQLELNVPQSGGRRWPGLQHKYRDTLLVFPSNGQTCHAYCSYCFRWAQFVGDSELRMATEGPSEAPEYLRMHPEVCEVVFTGGDPLVMSAKLLRSYIAPLLTDEFRMLKVIRIGTKSLAFWPHRFLTDPDSDELLRVLQLVPQAGKQLLVMAHVSHQQELSTAPVESAIRRLRSLGATIRTQAPVIRHVNDSAAAWTGMWNRTLELGGEPYYMFIARDTGPQHYYKVSLAEAVDIFRAAYSATSGSCRTVRGPVMSTIDGKVEVAVLEGSGAAHFLLTYVRHRDPGIEKRPFLASYSTTASWISDLTVVPFDSGDGAVIRGMRAVEGSV